MYNNRTSRTLGALILACALVGALGPKASSQVLPGTQTQRPNLEARRTSIPIIVDGDLNEAAWAEADSTKGPWIQWIPDAGSPSTQRTVAKVLYNEEFLYIGARMYDPDPKSLISAGLEQDFATGDSDIFGFVLDTYFDKRNGFLFAVNPAGALFDAQAFNDQQSVNRAWEGVVHVSTSVDEHGWTAEIAVPFNTLRFVPTEGPQTWGLNFSRRIRRINEDSSWSPLERQFRIYKVSRAGTLSGLTGLQGGRNLSVKPFFSASRGGPPSSTENDLHGGFDLKWGMTPQLTLDVTALTDFSQVEADEQQINLTRFSLFFPEKRDFFLENDGIFSFQDARVRNFRTGSGPQNFKLFHSRRIGLSDDRTPVPIAGGARLTGRLGPYSLGVLNMQTRDDPRFPGENFSVIRLRRNVFGSSDIGAMFVNRDGTGSGIGSEYNRSWGVDGNFRLFAGRMLVNSYVAATQSPSATGNQTASLLEVAWRDPLWNGSVLLKSVGEAFNPAVGFVRRRGVRQGFATLGIHPQPNVSWIREINPYIDLDVYSDRAWDLQSREVTPGVGVSFSDSGLLTLEYVTRYERLEEATSLAGGTVGAGEYTFGSFGASYRSDGGRRLSGSLQVSTGDFFDGTRTSFGGAFTVRPTVHWSVQGSIQRNRLTLGGERINANLLGGRLRYARNTRAFLSAFVQYNQAAEEVLSNIRLNLIHAPLSDVFLVYSDRRTTEASPGVSSVLDRALTLKVTKLLSF